jgi:hypothetical protein
MELPATMLTRKPFGLARWKKHTNLFLFMFLKFCVMTDFEKYRCFIKAFFKRMESKYMAAVRNFLLI